MSREWGPKFNRAGARLQAGIPRQPMGYNVYDTGGLLTRGVVVATYVYDNPNHPATDKSEDEPDMPVSVVCDVLVYSDIPNVRWGFLPGCIVSQDRAGLHSGRIWKPKAATVTISGTDFNVEDGPTEPADLDGDHVLIGFIDQNRNIPIILRSLPHPVRDPGKNEDGTGRRLQLKEVDGDPDYWKHHGTFYGVADNGDFIVDSSFANDGSLEEGGAEPAPPTDGKGSQRFKLEFNAEHEIQLLDMADPTAPVVKASLKLNKDCLDLQYEGASLKVALQDADATLTLGDGAVAVAVADHLETLYTMVGGIKAAFDNHIHGTGVGPSGPPSPFATFPAWDSNINSSKMTIPDT